VRGGLPDPGAETSGIVDALRDAGLTVGDAEPPVGVHGRQRDGSFTRYAVVWPLTGGTTSGTLGNPDEDLSVPYQITCVGESRRQAETMQVEVDRALADAGPRLVDGRWMTLRVDLLGGAQRDDTEQPPVFLCPLRLRGHTTPAPLPPEPED
jgi:hypothetical protein